MKKKASLSLSVNAIVVLILAIVMLALGLGFIRGMFSKVSAQIEQQIAAEPEPSIPMGSNPLTLSREVVIGSAKSDVAIKVSAFNPTNEVWGDPVPVAPVMKCAGFDNFVEPVPNTKKIEQGKYVTFTILFKIPEKAIPNSHLCEISLKDYRKDITIKVTE